MIVSWSLGHISFFFLWSSLLLKHLMASFMMINLKILDFQNLKNQTCDGQESYLKDEPPAANADFLSESAA